MTETTAGKKPMSRLQVCLKKPEPNIRIQNSLSQILQDWSELGVDNKTTSILGKQMLSKGWLNHLLSVNNTLSCVPELFTKKGISQVDTAQMVLSQDLESTR